MPRKGAFSHTGVPGLRQIAELAVPQMGLMLCHLGIAMTDLWAAGKLDAAVVASLGVVAQVFMLFMLVASVAGSGSLAAVSQALGAGLDLRARRYAGLIVLLAFCSGSLAGSLGYAALPFLLELLHVPEDLAPVVRCFVAVYCLNLPFHYALILLNSVFRAYKLVRLPCVAFFCVFCANAFGSLGFGLGFWGLPAYGYAGIAWSTFGATVIGLACNIAAATRRGILGRGAFPPRRWSAKALPYLLRVSIPTALGQLAEHGGRMVMLGLAAGLPDAVNVIAGMTLGMRVHSVIVFPLGAIGLTMAIFSGHMLGAGNHAALFRFGKNAAFAFAAIFALPAFALYCFRDTAVLFLAPDQNVASHAALCLAYACLGVPATACAVTLHGCFSGAGATPLGMTAGVASMWVVQVPLGWFLAYKLAWGARGVFGAVLLAEIAYGAIMAALYASRKWLLFGARANRRVNHGESGEQTNAE